MTVSTTTATSVRPPARRPGRRRFVRFAQVVLLGYAAVIIMLLFLENSLVYHPVRAAEGWFHPPMQPVADVSLKLEDGTPIHAWWCPVDASRGALLYCHGNAGNLSHRGSAVAAWQQEMGLSVLIFDYPGYGKSGGKPSEAGCYAAADAAYDWLLETAGIQAEDVVLYGGSLGGGVAVDLAQRRPHRALVVVSAFTSIPDMAQSLYPWLPGRWLVRNRFDNLAKIRRCTRPVFIAHGDEDALVPFSHGKRLAEAAREPKRFYPMAGHGHNEGPDHGFFTALRQFWKECEKAAAVGKAATGAAS